MRKKLLALLMCATMVLGTGVTAFAKPDETDYSNAATVIKNGSKVITEYDKDTNEKAITYSVFNDATKKIEYWGVAVIDNVFTPVKLGTVGDSSKKPILYAGTSVNGYAKTTSGEYVLASDFDNDVYASKTTDAAKQAYIDGLTKITSDEGAKFKTNTNTTKYTSDDLLTTKYDNGILSVANVNAEYADLADTIIAKNPSASATYVASANTLDASGNLVEADAASHLLVDNGFASVKVSSTSASKEFEPTDYLAYFVTTRAASAATYKTTIYFVNANGDKVAQATVTGASPTTASQLVVTDATATTVDGVITATANNGSFKSKAGSKYSYSDAAILPTGGVVYNSSNEKVYVTSNDPKAKEYTVDADGYVNGIAAPYSLFVADGSSVVRDDDSAQYYIVLSQATNTSGLNRTIAYALDDETISKDAVAVQVNLYELYETNETPATSTDKLKNLRRLDSVSSSVTITLADDVLSRTGLKKAEGIQVYSVDTHDVTVRDGADTYKFQDLGVATVGSSFSFSLRDFRDNVLIFDGAAEESNNDGVSDITTAGTTSDTAATTASTTAATSPKTGDVAPIAALAVVMMGACGAMVVASKKRA